MTIAGIVVLAAGCGNSGNSSTSPTPPRKLYAVSFTDVAGAPFGVTTTRDGRFAFVDLANGRVLVYSIAQGPPRLVRTIEVPGEAAGASLTRDDRLLLVADGRGAAVISVARAESGAAHPVLGMLSPPSSVSPQQGAGAIETSSSADGRYVFVSLEYGQAGGAIGVYDLGSDVKPRFGTGDYLGLIRLGQAVVGSALAPDGRHLYVTSEFAGQSAVRLQSGGTRTGAATNQALSLLQRADGTLSVIDVSTAERDPVRAVVATVPAMRQPVRVAVSPDGSTVWVTARASNRLLAFSASRLLTDPAKALITRVAVGTAPVGLALYDNGTRVIVADSNRENAGGAHSALTIINTHSALAHRPAVITTTRAGTFPREIAIERDSQAALVTNFGSKQLETVNLKTPATTR